MPTELDTLQQVVDFIAQLNPSSVQKMVDEYKMALDQIEKEVKKNELRMLVSYETHLMARGKLLDKHHREVLDKAKEVFREGLKLTEELTKEEIELLKKARLEEEAAETRKKVTQQRTGRLTGGAQMMGEMQKGFQGTFGTLTGMNIPTSVAGSLLLAARELNTAINRSRDMQRQQMQLAAQGTIGISGMRQMDGGLQQGVAIRMAVEDAVRQFGEERREQIQTAASTLASMMPILTEDAGQFNRAIDDVVVAAINLGMSVEETAKLQGTLMQKHGLSSTQASDALIHLKLELADVNKELAGRGGFNIASTIQQIVSLGDSLIPFGRGLDDSAKLIKNYAKELADGIITIQDFQQILTGVGRREEGTRAFLGVSLQERLAGDPKFAELASALRGLDPLVLQDVIEGIAETPQQMAKELGLGAGMGATLQDQLQEAVAGLTKDLARDLAGEDQGPSQRFFARRFESMFYGMDPNAPRAERMARRRALQGLKPLPDEEGRDVKMEDVRMRAAGVEDARVQQARTDAVKENTKQMGFLKNALGQTRTAFGEGVAAFKESIRALVAGDLQRAEAAAAQMTRGVVEPLQRAGQHPIARFGTAPGLLFEAHKLLRSQMEQRFTSKPLSNPAAADLPNRAAQNAGGPLVQPPTAME